MAAIDTRVQIVLSDDLANMRLFGLVGRGGRVAEQILSLDEKLLGYMVCLDESFMGECLWFLPESAIVNENDIQ
jgi:hypothetical protein